MVVIKLKMSMGEEDDLGLNIAALDAGIKAKNVETKKEVPLSKGEKEVVARNELADAKQSVADFYTEIANANNEWVDAINKHIENLGLSETQAIVVREGYDNAMKALGETLKIEGKPAIIDFQNAGEKKWNIGFNEKSWNSLGVDGLKEHARVAGIVLKDLKEKTSDWADQKRLAILDKELGNGS